MPEAPPEPVRLAVWSGPRNISTALMRSWENRPDTVVVDEPLYAHYLAVTGLDHPGRDEVVAAGETDWRAAVAGLTGPLPDGVRVHYQKHMAHHLVDEIDDRSWVLGLTNVLLVRDPAEVVASYTRSRAAVAPDDIGLLQQVRLHDELSAAGVPPLVVDAADFLDQPERFLRELCRLAGVGSPTGCCAGRPDPATATASGRRTGTRRSSAPPASSAATAAPRSSTGPRSRSSAPAGRPTSTCTPCAGPPEVSAAGQSPLTLTTCRSTCRTSTRSAASAITTSMSL